MRSPSLLLLAAAQVIYTGLTAAYDTPNTYSPPAPHSRTAKVKGYYPSYNSDNGQKVDQIPYELYTDLIFFVVIPQLNNTLSFDPSFSPSYADKLAHDFVANCKKNGVNPSVSAGGWTGSQHFSNLTAFDYSRKAFAKTLVDFCKKYGFTGADLDWEYPNSAAIGCNAFNPRDTANFGLWVKEIRALWPEGILSAAISLNGLVGASGSAAIPDEVSLLAKNLDYINLMAYDVYGAWAPTTGPVAPLSAACAPADYAVSAETGIQVALKQGFRPEQIILGIPGYGKRSQLVSPKLVPTTTNGKTSYFYQNKTTVTPAGGKFDDAPGVDICGAKTTWGGSFLTMELIQNGWLSADTKTALGGYKRYFDECSGTPFITNGTYLISYDDEQSTVLKAKYAKEHNLAGVFFFDTQGPTDATVQAAGRVIKGQ